MLISLHIIIALLKFRDFFLNHEIHEINLSRKFHVIRGAFHLVKNSENSGSGLNGKRFLGSPDGKIPRKSGTAQKVVPFSRWKLSNGKFVFHLQISRLYCFYHQFHTFRGLLSGQASLGPLEWNLWQMERALPKWKFPIEIFPIFL